MAKPKEIYICSACGARSVRWQGQCSQCREWNTLEAALETSGKRAVRVPGQQSGPMRLDEVPEGGSQGISTCIDGLDALLGNGLVPGGIILLGGEPGIGKSTLLLQLAARVASSGQETVYASGEESLGQLQGRARRLKVLDSGLSALATTRLDDILDLMDRPAPPTLIILDSVQTMASAQVDGIPGSMSQVRAVATQVIEKAKQCGTTVVLVGHVTKEGQIAGPKLLEHMVDTVLYLEGDKQHLFRMLRVVKNRFGPSNELLLFEMQSRGMEVVHDPSTFFLQARDPGLSGTALVMGMEAQRPFAVEVQALATKTFLAFPRRTALGFDANRLNLLLAVMEKRLRINTGQTDIYAKVGGGLRLQDPGMDLGLVAAVLSSFYDRALPEGAVFWGEVDLNGQIRPVFGQDMRLRQARRIGYDPIFCPADSKGGKGWSNLLELQRYLFGKS